MVDYRMVADSESHEISEGYQNDRSGHNALNASGGISTPQSLAGRYQFIRKLGEGSQAKVFLAKRLSDNLNVAIKQLDIDSVSNWKEYDLFHREVATLSSLNIHGVARFYEALECLDDKPPCSYLVQEYIKGESLAAMLKAGRRFSTDQVYDIIIQMLSILYQLQSLPEPVIHRDIKPSNIMLTPKNSGYHVTLIDFGAVANPQVQSGGSTVAGTYGYMPPEQLMGHPLPVSDIYSLGAVAVELFSGKSPATLPTKDFRLIFEPEMQSQPPALVDTLRKMLEPKVDARFCNIALLRRIFVNYKSGNFSHASEASRKDKFYQEALLGVCDIGAPGNIDLWQKLPDKPGRDVPEIFYHIARSDSKENLEPDNRSKSNAEQRNSNAYSRKISLSQRGTSILTFITLLSLALICYAAKIGSGLIAAIACCVFIAGTVFCMTFTIEYESQDDDDDDDDVNDAPSNANMRIADLLAIGRKTIATIVDIEYLPIKNMEHRSNQKYVVKARPRFRIDYKFNPPDDDRSEDLVHSCIVHTEPDNFYKINDPLPIVYHINGKGMNERVYSCPFPFPVKSSNESELMCSSSAGDAFRKYCSQLSFKSLYPRNVDHIKCVIKYAKNGAYRNLSNAIIACIGDGNDLYFLSCIEDFAQMFLGYSNMMPVHSICIQFLLSKYIFDITARYNIDKTLISYLKRIEAHDPGTDIQVVKVILKSNAMSVLPDKIIDEIAWLCSRKEIRDIVSAEIPLGGLHKLRMRIIELKVTDSVDGKLVGDLVNV